MSNTLVSVTYYQFIINSFSPVTHSNESKRRKRKKKSLSIDLKREIPTGFPNLRIQLPNLWYQKTMKKMLHYIISSWFIAKTYFKEKVMHMDQIISKH